MRRGEDREDGGGEKGRDNENGGVGGSGRGSGEIVG